MNIELRNKKVTVLPPARRRPRLGVGSAYVGLKASVHACKWNEWDKNKKRYVNKRTKKMKKYEEKEVKCLISKPRGLLLARRRWSLRRAGGLMADYNRKICQFKYNYLTLPQSVQYRYGHRIEYTYDASGMKRTVTYKTSNKNMNYYPWDDRVPASGDFYPSPVTRQYMNNKVYENNNLKYILTEEGYIEKVGSSWYRYFYLKDRLGNNRVVMDVSGKMVQANNYYPSGVSMAESPVRSDQGVQPYKFGDKELDRFMGLDFYDFEMRAYDPTLMRYTRPDPSAEKYYSVSPYAYAANNPVRNIDLRGDSVTVLNLGDWTDQHMAMLIQNDAGKWQYFSFNGDIVYNSTDGSVGGRPFNDMAVGEFDSPQQFMDSKYNQSNGKEGKTDASINSYGYPEGYVLPTTPEQDNTIRDTFTDAVNQGYSLKYNQCSQATQKALNAAGIKTTVTYTTQSTRWGETFQSTRTHNPYLPSQAYNAIKANNPQGFTVYKRK